MVAGATNVYRNIAEQLDCEGQPGIKAFKLALEKPTEQLAYNAGLKMPSELGEEFYGWDPVQNVFRNLWEDPKVIDPTEVLCAVLRSAVSVALSIVSSEISITNKR